MALSTKIKNIIYSFKDFPGGPVVKNLSCNAGDMGRSLIGDLEILNTGAAKLLERKPARPHAAARRMMGEGYCKEHTMLYPVIPLLRVELKTQFT